MAKRASLSFDAVKASKGGAADPAPPAVEPAPMPAAPAKRGRGRPAKRDPAARVFGMTLRIPGDLRRELRRLAEDETERQGRVVSVHDVILDAVAAHLARKGRRG